MYFVIIEGLVMHETVGEKIKKLRNSLGIPQEGLAYGICSQSEISRIENNRFKSSYTILLKIASRLGVDINYLLENENNERNDYVKEVNRQLNEALRLRNYELVNEIVKLEVRNPAFKQGDQHDYLMWHMGLSHYELNKQKGADVKEKAIEILLSCLSDNLYRELDINVLNSIGIIYRNEKELENALLYIKKAYNIAEKTRDYIDEKLVLKIYYNLSKIYTDLGEVSNDQGRLNRSIVICEKGIKSCIENERLFLMVEFHYQIGRNYLFLGEDDKCLDYWTKAMFLNTLVGKTDLNNYIENDIEEYNKKGFIKKSNYHKYKKIKKEGIYNSAFEKSQL